MRYSHFKFKIIIFTLLIFSSFLLFGLVNEVAAGCSANSSFCTSRPTYCKCYYSGCSPGWPEDWYAVQQCVNGAWCVDCESDCSCGNGGCFTGETEINVKETKGTKETDETREIKDLKPGDIVSSFDPETGEISEGTVSDVTKITREGYYILETESGKKVRVTAEHPFLAIKAKNDQASNSPAERDPAVRDKFQTTLDGIKDILSQTLTYKVITNLRSKLVEILP